MSESHHSAMNTHEQAIRARANKKATELVKDTAAYVEGVGKTDKDTLGDSERRSTTLRLILGATATMPHRALSYVDSALRIAHHFPDSQVHIIHANHLGNKVNGIDIEQAKEQSSRLNAFVLQHLVLFPHLEGRVIHAHDTPHDTDQFTDLAQSALERQPDLARKMQQKGAKHGGDALRYIAAHYAFQDTDELELDVMYGGPQQPSERIISIGCQQERNFYLARMAMRHLQQGEIDTAQIFTRHLTPPYFEARGGEPLLGHFNDTQSITDSGARRDMEHFIKHTTSEGEHHE